MKRIQNQVAESRYTLPAAALYGAAVWLLCGLLAEHWWVQFCCFVLSTYLMVELNNSNALIRIYSRMVSAAFVVLSCVASFVFPSMEGAIAQLCVVTSLLTLFRTYQDGAAVGGAFYTFVCLGLASLVAVHALWLVPVYWILMGFFLYSLSWRTFAASLLGLALPYWVMTAWVLWYHEGDFALFAGHFASLADFSGGFDYSRLTVQQLLTVALLTGLGVTGSIHYVRNSSGDKIRIRQIFYSFILLGVLALGGLAISPCHYDLAIRMLVIATSPLIAHFLALTNTRVTNIAFYVICGLTLLLTVFNLLTNGGWPVVATNHVI